MARWTNCFGAHQTTGGSSLRHWETNRPYRQYQYESVWKCYCHWANPVITLSRVSLSILSIFFRFNGSRLKLASFVLALAAVALAESAFAQTLTTFAAPGAGTTLGRGTLPLSVYTPGESTAFLLEQDDSRAYAIDNAGNVSGGSLMRRASQKVLS